MTKIKRVLLVVPEYSSYYLPIKKALNGQKIRTDLFDNRKSNKVEQIFSGLSLIIPGAKNVANLFLNKRLVKMARKVKPDLILVIKGENISKKTVNELGKIYQIVNWFPDPMSQWKLMKNVAAAYTIFFHFDPLIIRKLKRLGLKNIKYLPFAAEISAGKKIKPIYEISFIGTYSPYREKYLSAVKDLGLSIWGDERWKVSTLGVNLVKGRIPPKQMKQIFQSSKININLIHNGEREGTNLRTFEITGSGGFLLSEYVKDLDNLFIVGKELIVFKNHGQLRSRVREWLKKDQERSKIALAGFKKASTRHNYGKRMEEMLEIISQKYG